MRRGTSMSGCSTGAGFGTSSTVLGFGLFHFFLIKNYFLRGSAAAMNRRNGKGQLRRHRRLHPGGSDGGEAGKRCLVTRFDVICHKVLSFICEIGCE